MGAPLSIVRKFFTEKIGPLGILGPLKICKSNVVKNNFVKSLMFFNFIYNFYKNYLIKTSIRGVDFEVG